MTLDKLVVENFGIYLDRHVITLTPPSRKKPIVLFGGMNGSGKTTLLDALQLCLHGRRARCSNTASGVQPTGGRSGRTPAEPYPPDGAAEDSGEKPYRPAEDHPWRKGFKRKR